MQMVLLHGGRSYTWIQRNNAGRVIKLQPMEPTVVTVALTPDGSTTYTYAPPGVAPRVLRELDPDGWTGIEAC